MATKKTIVRIRDAGNGKFVPNGTEKRRPNTTIKDRMKLRK